MAGGDTRGGQYVDTGHVLSKYSGWGDAKSNPGLWFLILLFNAFFTTIGVGIRDLCGGKCMLTQEHPFGNLNCANRTAFYICTVVIGGASFIIVARFNYLYQSWRVFPNKENSENCKSVINPIIQHLLINLFIVLSGTLYIAADNYFFLVDPVDGEPNGSHIRSFLAGSSLVCTACVFAINQWFKKINCSIGTKSEETSCSEECFQIRENSASKICRHGRDHKNCDHTSGKCIHKYEKGICTLHCCTPHYFGEIRKICRHGRDHAKCRIDCDYVNDELKKNRSKEYLKFVIFWYPMPIIIATFDSIFLSVVDEISDDDNRKGFDCENNMFGRNGALIFYIVISVLMWTSIIGITVVRCWNMYTYICQVDKTASSKKCNCLIITYSIIMCLIFIVVGTVFTAVDNNWPWICFAGEICTWVISRVILLALLTVIIFCFTMVIFIVTLGLWCLDCSAKPGGEPESRLGAETGEEPDRGTGEEPDRGTGEEPDRGTGEEPDRGTGEEPDRGTGEAPDRGTGEEPDRGTGEEPDRGTGEEPDSRTGEEPDSRTECEPDSRTGEEPDSRTEGEPDSRTGEEPDNRTGDKADSGTGKEPDSRTGGESEHVTQDEQMSKPQTLDRPREDVPTNTRQKVMHDMVQKDDDTSHRNESDIPMKPLQKSKCKPETVTEDASEC